MCVFVCKMLRAGSLKQLYFGKPIENPVFQVFSTPVMDAGSSKRYKIVLSDGEHFVVTNWMSSLIPLIEEKGIRQGSLVRIVKSNSPSLDRQNENSRIVMVCEALIVEDQTSFEQIGNPVSLRETLGFVSSSTGGGGGGEAAASSSSSTTSGVTTTTKTTSLSGTTVTPRTFEKTICPVGVYHQAPTAIICGAGPGEPDAENGTIAGLVASQLCPKLTVRVVDVTVREKFFSATLEDETGRCRAVCFGSNLIARFAGELVVDNLYTIYGGKVVEGKLQFKPKDCFLNEIQLGDSTKIESIGKVDRTITPLADLGCDRSKHDILVIATSINASVQQMKINGGAKIMYKHCVEIIDQSVEKPMRMEIIGSSPDRPSCISGISLPAVLDVRRGQVNEYNNFKSVTCWQDNAIISVVSCQEDENAAQLMQWFLSCRSAQTNTTSRRTLAQMLKAAAGGGGGGGGGGRSEVLCFVREIDMSSSESTFLVCPTGKHRQKLAPLCPGSNDNDDAMHCVHCGKSYPVSECGRSFMLRVCLADDTASCDVMAFDQTATVITEMSALEWEAEKNVEVRRDRIYDKTSAQMFMCIIDTRCRMDENGVAQNRTVLESISRKIDWAAETINLVSSASAAAAAIPCLTDEDVEHNNNNNNNNNGDAIGAPTVSPNICTLATVFFRTSSSCSSSSLAVNDDEENNKSGYVLLPPQSDLSPEEGIEAVWVYSKFAPQVPQTQTPPTGDTTSTEDVATRTTAVYQSLGLFRIIGGLVSIQGRKIFTIHGHKQLLEVTDNDEKEFFMKKSYIPSSV